MQIKWEEYSAIFTTQIVSSKFQVAFYNRNVSLSLSLTTVNTLSRRDHNYPLIFVLVIKAKRCRDLVYIFY